MKTKIKNQNATKLMIIVLLAFALFSSLVSVFVYTKQDTALSEKYDVEIMRRMISDASDGLKSPLPTDPRTGDMYVHQHRLMLRNNENLFGLEYSYNTPNETGSEMVSFSSKSMQVSAQSPFISANTMEDLLNSVPAKQACHRGISVHNVQATDNLPELEFYRAKQLADGRTVYLYTEVECPSLKAHVEYVYVSLDSY